MALGKYPDVPLAEARKRHIVARALLATGIDPMAVRKEQMRMTKAAFTELERYLEAIGISLLTIENEIVTRSEEILNES
jgi:hypothetical protein